MTKYISRTKSARGSFRCVECSRWITKGDRFYQWSLRNGPGGILFRQHVKCGTPKRSRLTLGKMQRVFIAVEEAAGLLKLNYPDTDHVVSNLINQILVVRFEYQEAYDKQPHTLQQASHAGQRLLVIISELDKFTDDLKDRGNLLAIIQSFDPVS
jgi:hypothetical protein